MILLFVLEKISLCICSNVIVQYMCMQYKDKFVLNCDYIHVLDYDNKYVLFNKFNVVFVGCQ